MLHTHKLFSSLATLLAFLILLHALPLYAFAADHTSDFSHALGDVLYAISQPIAPDTLLTTEFLQDASPQTTVFLTYSPGDNVVPVAAYGNRLYGKSTISTVADFVANRGRPVIAAINGDFFSTATGLPMGIVVTDGILRSSDAGRNAVGFRADGSALIGTPGLTMTLRGTTTVLPVAHLNKLRTAAGGIYLLTGDFSGETRNQGAGCDVMLRVLEGEPRIGGTMRLRVEDVIETDISMAIPEGVCVLTASVDSTAYPLLTLMQPREELTLSIEAQDPAWNDVTQAVGGGDLLVEDGQICANFDNAIAAANPRTAIGICRNGDVLLYALDGRRSGYSAGATLSQLAREFAARGCISAINLDGGGSTALLAKTPDESYPSLKTKPSDGGLRAVANAILLCSASQPTEEAELLHITPYGAVALAGSVISLSSHATDENYFPAPLPSHVTLSLEGEQDRDGLLRVPDRQGTYTVRAKAGSLSGSAPLTVIETPDVLSVYAGNNTISSLTLDEGEQVHLSVRAVWCRQNVLLSSDAVSFSVEGAAATVDSTGLLTASDASGTTGTLIVAAGDRKVEIPLSTGKSPYTVEPFEQGSSWNASGAEAALTQTHNDVARGMSALRIDYNFLPEELPETDAPPTNPSEQPIDPEQPEPESANSSEIEMETEPTETLPPTEASEKPVEQEDDGLPEGLGLSLEEAPRSERLLSLYLAESDSTAEPASFSLTPSAALSLKDSPTHLSFFLKGDAASLTLNFGTRTVDYSFPGSNKYTFCVVAIPHGAASLTGIKVTPQQPAGSLFLDQITACYTSSPRAEAIPLLSELKADPVSDEQSASLQFTLTATASDASGGPVESLTLTQNGRSIPCSYNKDTLTVTAAVSLREDELTRFTLTACGAFGTLARTSLTLGSAGETEVPFADMHGHWAAEPVAYAAAQGLFSGEVGEGGALCFRPDRSMTRAEIAAVLVRLLGENPEAYAGTSLPFEDNQHLPEWAVPYIKTVYALGLVSGRATSTGVVYAANDSVTRGELMTMLAKTLPKGYPAPDLTFADSAKVPEWARESVSVLTGLKLLSGYEDNTVRTGGTVKRSEAAKILAGLF